MRHISKIEKLEITADIKNSREQGMPPKEIHEDFIETLGKETPAHSEKNGQLSLRG